MPQRLALIRLKGCSSTAFSVPKTVGAVLFFQQALSRTIPALPVNGSVDPLTWRALVSGMLAC